MSKRQKKRFWTKPANPSRKEKENKAPQPAIVDTAIVARFQQALQLHQQGQLDQAMEIYQRIVECDTSHADALQLLGLIHKQKGNFAVACELIDRALLINPRHYIALNNRGHVLNDLKRYNEALAYFDQALAIKPDYPHALNLKGAALHELKRYQEALESYDRALSFHPNFPEALFNRGTTLRTLKRYDESLKSCDQALRLQPDLIYAQYNRGLTLYDLRRFDEALISFDQVQKFKFFEHLPGRALHCRQYMCQWQGIDEVEQRLLKELEEGKAASGGLTVLAMPSTPAQQQRCSQLNVIYKRPSEVMNLAAGIQYKHDKIRLGYFSADFHNHATAYLIAELFELHDRSRFEVIGFSYGPDNSDEMRQRLEGGFDRLINVQHRTDKEIALLARDLEIDIAIDLKGDTQDARLGIFAFRPAPLQVHYLGYPGTIGADYLDYLIADPVLIPEEHRPFYDEKIVYLPDSYQVNDRNRQISGHQYTRSEVGLPEKGFVFCCFNNNYKITPQVFDIWMHVLRETAGSVLWLLDDNAFAVANLKKEAERRGVASERLCFAARIKLPEHLARCRLADLFLDTFYYGAHTTASDALWAGVPVLTYLGDSFVSRVCASLLSAMGLPELITHSHEEYRTHAYELAHDSEKLQAIKNKVAINRDTAPLFDTPRFTKHLEAAYIEMWRRWQVGLSPEHIQLKNLFWHI